ncbi:MAG: cupin domain-containing protein [Ignavibacteriaceae bacterium]|jgi:mannose-6-phosphate isomerase-like protein (cupin superfamily)
MKKTIFQMTEIKSINNTEHYTWGDNCNGWHLLKTNRLSVIQEEMPSNTSEQYHFHINSQQLFYILSGAATFQIEGQVFVVNKNESIHIPKGIKHCIANKSKRILKFIVISEPKSHGDRQNGN